MRRLAARPQSGGGSTTACDRPCLQSLRLAVRRALARAQKRASFPVWPVDTTVDDLQASVMAAAMRAAGQTRLAMLGWWPGGKRYAVVLRHDVEGMRGVANIDTVRRIEERRGLRSLWNFVPERYPLDGAVLQTLRDAGHEIGVHGLYHDGRLFENHAEFLRRAERINDYLEAWDSRRSRRPRRFAGSTGSPRASTSTSTRLSRLPR